MLDQSRLRMNLEAEIRCSYCGERVDGTYPGSHSCVPYLLRRIDLLEKRLDDLEDGHDDHFQKADDAADEKAYDLAYGPEDED